MAKNKKLEQPSMVEVSPVDKTHEAMGLYINKILQNEDTVLTERGNAHDFKIYRELLRDDQVYSTWQQRMQALVGKETIIEPASDSAADKAAAAALEEDILAIGWDEITKKMMHGIFYGYGVAEIMWGHDRGRYVFDNIKVRRPWRFRYDKEGKLYLITSTNIQGEQMPEKKFWTFSTGADNSDNPYGVGLGHHLYWPVFFKRNDIKFWLIFLEKFGMPTAVGKLPGALIEDANKRQQVLDALRSLSSDSAIVLPETAEYELVEAARSGTADYATLHERMNQAISKIVLSQTMTTDDGSSRSQAEVHKDVRDEVIQADADLICESFNQGPVKWWTEWNFPGAKPPRVTRKTEEEEDLDSKVERDTKIYSLGFEPTDEYIKETYGDGYQRRDVGLSFGPGGNSDLPEEFAEAASRIISQKVRNRGDQESIRVAARDFSDAYNEVLGGRLSDLVAQLDETGDLLSFREKLNELIEQPPKDEMVEHLRNSGIVSRLMGVFRGQQ